MRTDHNRHIPRTDIEGGLEGYGQKVAVRLLLHSAAEEFLGLTKLAKWENTTGVIPNIRPLIWQSFKIFHRYLSKIWVP